MEILSEERDSQTGIQAREVQNSSLACSRQADAVSIRSPNVRMMYLSVFAIATRRFLVRLLASVTSVYFTTRACSRRSRKLQKFYSEPRALRRPLFCGIQ